MSSRSCLRVLNIDHGWSTPESLVSCSTRLDHTQLRSWHLERWVNAPTLLPKQRERHPGHGERAQTSMVHPIIVADANVVVRAWRRPHMVQPQDRGVAEANGHPAIVAIDAFVQQGVRERRQREVGAHCSRRRRTNRGCGQPYIAIPAKPRSAVRVDCTTRRADCSRSFAESMLKGFMTVPERMSVSVAPI